MQTMLLVRCVCYAMSLILSVADIERIHGRTKRNFTKGGSSFVGSSTKSYLEELRSVSICAARRTDELLPWTGFNATDARNAILYRRNGKCKASRPKQKSAYERFLDDQKLKGCPNHKTQKTKTLE